VCSIVLLHEYGHALACRQVGGIANRIVLWPLGGVAYVDPPPRPGAMLWSIAAGPLVNVVLFFVLTLTGMLGRSHGWFAAVSNIHTLVLAIWYINLSLLIFTLLPIYPLDGGHNLQSLVWFVLGRARSLMVAVSIGFIGVAGLIALALWIHSAWFVVLSFFILMNCWGGLKQARALSRLAKLPRREGFTCPCCKLAPPIGAFWKCAQCGQPFDTFETQAVCPKCNARFAVTGCLDCRRAYPLSEWMAPAFAATRGQWVVLRHSRLAPDSGYQTQVCRAAFQPDQFHINVILSDSEESIHYYTYLAPRHSTS